MTVTKRLSDYLFGTARSAPLAFFRMAFGIMMFLSILRFAINGWIDTLYVQPVFFFPFYGFEWIKPLNQTGMYVVFGLMAVAALFIALGLLYRPAIISFFLLFTYVELLDKSNYLNHYYFISLISFLLCFLPANCWWSLDTKFGFTKFSAQIPRWSILIIQLQMATVYFFAGIAKINTDWLLHAEPLKIWLASKNDLPLIGRFLHFPEVAFIFSWCGMLFDVLIAFFLFNRRTVWFAYLFVIVFHTLTAILFPGIGMFPYVMMVSATIFLPESFFIKLSSLLKWKANAELSYHKAFSFPIKKGTTAFIAVYFVIQLALPLRYLLYPDNLFYHEQGFRFSWRVMLMEKAGAVFFTVRDASGNLIEVNNGNFLTPQQEKQMSTQPDMMLQFAHHLAGVYHSKEVYAEAYVTVNGQGSRLLIDPSLNLVNVSDGFTPKSWILATAK